MPEVVIGASSYPWRVDFNLRKLKVYRKSNIVVEIPSKNLKEVSFEDILKRLEIILKDYLDINPVFKVAELELKFAEWKKCLK